MDIIESIKNIEEYVSGMNYEQFLKDKKNKRCGNKKHRNYMRSIEKDTKRSSRKI